MWIDTSKNSTKRKSRSSCYLFKKVSESPPKIVSVSRTTFTTCYLRIENLQTFNFSIQRARSLFRGWLRPSWGHANESTNIVVAICHNFMNAVVRGALLRCGIKFLYRSATHSARHSFNLCMVSDLRIPENRSIVIHLPNKTKGLPRFLALVRRMNDDSTGAYLQIVLNCSYQLQVTFGKHHALPIQQTGSTCAHQ